MYECLFLGPGVLLSAFFTALFPKFIFVDYDWDWATSLMFGAIVCSLCHKISKHFLKVSIVNCVFGWSITAGAFKTKSKNSTPKIIFQNVSLVKFGFFEFVYRLMNISSDQCH